jgi:predicted ribosome quality control (RQC) complex YloA/Tae2 family protein
MEVLIRPSAIRIIVKKELSSLDVRVLARELSATLVDGHIDKAYQPTYDDLLLTVTGGGKARRRLHIRIGKYVCVTEREREMPQAPSQYAMLLRKYIGGARIAAVEQHGFDRIIVLHLTVRDEPFRLVCELFRNGTVILVHRDDIVKPYTSRSWGTRDVKAGKEFLMPPPRLDPAAMGFKAFTEAVLASDADVVRTLATKLGLGGEYAEGLISMSNIPSDAMAAELDVEEMGLLFENLQVLFRMADSEPRPQIVRRDGKAVSVLPVDLPRSQGDVVEPFATLNAAVEAYFAETLVEERPDVVSEEFMGHVQKLERQAGTQRDAEIAQEAEVKRCIRLGDIVYANYKLVEDTLWDIIQSKDALGWEDAIRRTASIPHIKRLDPSTSTLAMTLPDGEGATVEVELSLNLTVVENANMWYERAKRAREKAAGAKEALEDTLARLQTARKRLKEARQDHTAREEAITAKGRGRRGRERRREFWFEQFRWLITSDGAIVVAGRDAQSNERVVKRYLRERDRYCHADFSGAPSTVAKDPGGGVPDRSVSEACALSVIYSKAWSGGRASADAYWVMPEQVSKTAESGEFVPKGAFIIRGRRNYIKDLQMRLAVGLVEHKGVEMVMGGPVEPVRARSTAWVELVPSNDKKDETAKEVARSLGVTLEEVMRVMPPGGCRVVSRHGLEDPPRD